MARRFVSWDLFGWVGCYALLGGVPFVAVLFMPQDVLQTRVAGTEEQPIRAVQVGMWFPVTMFIAAGTTLVVGLISATLQFGTGRLGIIAPTWVRTFVAVFGVSAILAGVLLVWLSISQGALFATVQYILVCISLGIGLATGATYYRDE